MRSVCRGPGVLVVVLALVCFQAGVALGQDDALNAFVDGVEYFDAPDYVMAVESFRRAVDLEPDNLEYRFYLGLGLKALGETREALDVFTAVVQLDPVEFESAFFEMAGIHTDVRDFEAALAVLQSAEQALPGNSRVQMEKGLTLRSLQRYEEALAAFERAAAIDPDLRQAALYNQAAVNFEWEAYDRAGQLFEQAIAVDPQSSLARNARLSLKNVKRAKHARRPWFFSGSLGWGYDTNVSLDPEDMVFQRPAGQPTDKEDQFQTFSLNGTYRFFNRKDLELGIGYRMRMIGYKEWVDNNLLGHRPYLHLRVTDEPIVYQFTYEPSLWYDGGSHFHQDRGLFLAFGSDADKLLRVHRFTSGATISEIYDMQTQINLSWEDKRYFDNLTSDAQRWSAEVIQSIKLPGTEIFPRLGVKYVSETADPENDSYDYVTIQAGASAPLFLDIVADLSLTYGKVNFEYNPAYTTMGERDDDQLRFTASLARALGRYCRVVAYYEFTDNDSDVVGAGGLDPFEFQKSIYSLMLNVAY